MRGLMMDSPLLISSLIEYAAEYHGATEIVSRTHDHPLHRYTYREAEGRPRRLAKALVRLGVQTGDRIATLAWNDFRHFEIYYATSGMGAVCHTLNPRLFPEHSSSTSSTMPRTRGTRSIRCSCLWSRLSRTSSPRCAATS